MESNKKALIAMSGGVDSSVAAFLMKEKGYDCVGVTMKLYSNELIEKEEACTMCQKASKTCCSLDDVEDARSVAARLDIPYHVFNFTAQFEEEVVKKFVDTYIDGKTPNPCIDCNRYMKFERLMQRMYELSLDYIVTGHYARIAYDADKGRYTLSKAVDASKDQSYVLYHFTQKQLEHTLMPLGEFPKTEIRKIAEQHGFINANKHDSQDICFVPDGDYASFIERYTQRKFEEGDFVLEDGTVVGRHKGLIRYTIGQRKGLSVAYSKPLYVLYKDMEKNQVVLGDNEKLFERELLAKDLNFIAFDRIEGKLKCKAKIRYKQPEADAIVTQIDETHIKVIFDEPQRGIAKGQAVVLYQGDEVLGGGTIC